MIFKKYENIYEEDSEDFEGCWQWGVDSNSMSIAARKDESDVMEAENQMRRLREQYPRIDFDKI